MRTLRTIPAVATLAGLLDLINERFRTFNSADSGDAFSGDMGGSRITNLGHPGQMTDAATAGWVEARFAKKGEGGGVGAPGPPGPPGTGVTPWVPVAVSGSSVTFNMASGDRFIVTVSSAAVTINAPVGLIDDHILDTIWVFTVDCDLTWNAAFPTRPDFGPLVGAAGSKARAAWDVVAGTLYLKEWIPII